jgi:hypothetical protein
VAERRVGCAWPGCTKRVRAFFAGRNYCRPHMTMERNAFFTLTRLEGPATLNRPLPTLAELVEVAQTGAVPATRQAPVTLETTQIRCLLCAGPLLMVNDADWSPDLPNALSTRTDGTAWGLGWCPCCSLRSCRHCLMSGVLVDGHDPDLVGRCQRCGKETR